MSLLAPIMDFTQSEEGQKLFAVARQFFGNSNITVNLLPLLLLGGLLLLGLPLLLALVPGLFGGGTSGGGTNYQVYGDSAGGGGYGAPSDSYGGGGGGGSSYAAPSSSYDARSSYDYRSDESYEGEYRALQDNLLAAQNDYLEDREGELSKRIGDLVAPVAQKLGEAAAKMIH